MQDLSNPALAEIVNELEDMMYVSDPETYNLLYLNAYTRKLCQLPPNASLDGQKCYQVLYGQNSPCDFCPLSRCTHQQFYTWDSFNSRLKRYYTHRDKLIVWNDKDAHLSYSIDMTEPKKIENELLISEQCFNIAMDNSERSLFDIDLMTHSQYNRRLNEPLSSLTKLVKNVPETIIDQGIIHPDSVDRFRDMYQQIFYGESGASDDILVIDANGNEIWCHFIITTIFRKDGSPLRAIGVCENISRQKTLSLKYQKSKEYQAFLLRDSVIFLDTNLVDNKLVRYEHNPDFAYQPDSSMTYSSMIKELTKEYCYPADADVFLNTFSRTALMVSWEDNETDITLEHRIKIGNSYCWVSTSAHFVRETDQPSACILLMKNIDEQKKHEDSLLYSVEHDEQTGFFLLNAISKKINDSIQTDFSSSVDKYSALLLIRIDSLTSLFSKYGNKISSHYISSFCSKLTSLLRSDDMIARCNDNLFLIYVRNLSSINAVLDVSRNIMDSLRAFFYNEPSIQINIGCACLPYDGNSFEEIYEHAEDALSDSVRQGNGQFACYKTSFDKLTPAESAFNSMQVMEKEIENYENNHPIVESTPLDRYDNRIFSLGNKAFKEVNSFSLSSLVVTISVSIILFITLLFGIYTETFFKINDLLGRIIWVALHAIILLLMWFRMIYFYQKSVYGDSVTGGNSKHYFEKKAPGLYSREGMRFAIVYTNISKFKLLNDKYGHQTGDDILKRIHKIYDSSLMRGEMSARLMADDFVLLVHFKSYDDLCARLESMDAQIKALRDYNGDSYHIDTYYGVYVIMNPDLPVTKMLDCASIALTNLSKTTRIPIGFYDDRITLHMQYERDIESRMRSALNQHEFEIYFLPKYRTHDLTLVGAEALIRWHDSQFGVLLPEDFLPIFEQNGFIVQTDLYVFESVCKSIRKWLDNGFHPYPISFNISKTNLEIPKFLDVYKEILSKYQIPENLIEFELTESVIYDHYDIYRSLMDEIHEMKCLCTLDDFGSSYSSVSMLKSLPVDVLKIDRNLLFSSNADPANDSGSIQAIRSIVDLAKSIGAVTLFEGVETEEQLIKIQSTGCEQLQGTLCSEALPIDEFEKLAFGRRL